MSIVSPEFPIAAARYVEQNPVRAKMVRKPWDYQWSSARFHMGGTDPLVTDRTLLGLVKDWRELLEGEDEEADEKLRTGVKIGRPVGSESFIERVEALTGRDLAKVTKGGILKRRNEYCVPGIPDPLVTDRTLLGLVKDWRELLEGEDEEADEKLRAGVKIGRPVGSESFIERVEALTGRDLGKGHPGRHPKTQK